jgi:hypothetical protein
MFHAIWRILIDDDFLDAYRDGIIIKCYDGVTCRVFPRIFTYAADYPEKCVNCTLLAPFLLMRPWRVLIAAIRDKGVHPCPRCLLPKSYFGRIGLHYDVSGRVARAYQSIKDTVIAARNTIYKLGTPIKGAAVERLLKELSLVPTVVSISCLCPTQPLFYLIHRTPLLNNWALLALTAFQCLSSTFYMSSS